MGGTCSVNSRPGKGTKVMVRVPLREDMASGEDKDIDS